MIMIIFLTLQPFFLLYQQSTKREIKSHFSKFTIHITFKKYNPIFRIRIATPFITLCQTAKQLNSKQLNTSNDTIVWMENRKTSSIPKFRIKLLDYLYDRRILTLLSFFDDASSFIRLRSIIISSTRASYRICRRWIESSSSEIWFRIFSSSFGPPEKGPVVGV